MRLHAFESQQICGDSVKNFLILPDSFALQFSTDVDALPARLRQLMGFCASPSFPREVV